MFERFFGAKESEIIGKTDYDFVDRDLAEFFRENDRKAMAADSLNKNEEKLTFADNGYSGIFETIKTPMRDSDGKLIGVLGIARDITAQKQAEKELKRSTSATDRSSQSSECRPVGMGPHYQQSPLFDRVETANRI